MKPRLAKVTDLEEYRAAVMALAADELATGKQLALGYRNAASLHPKPIVAHLVALADAIDDALEADSYTDMRAALVQMSDGARREARERERKAER